MSILTASNHTVKILYFDLETTPIMGYAWRTYKTNLFSIEKESSLLAFSWKINDGLVQVLSRRTHTEKQMTKKLWQLFDEADVICAHNGDNFDIKFSNKLFIRHGHRPPSPYKKVDTLKMARRYFRFDSNKLDDLSKFMLGEEKIHTSAQLWKDCMAGQKNALIEMERYCKHDVVLLSRLYSELRAWHTGHPNYNVYNGTTHQCPVCGSDCQRRGTQHTRVGVYQRYQCKNKNCGAWSQGEKVATEKVIR